MTQSASSWMNFGPDVMGLGSSSRDAWGAQMGFGEDRGVLEGTKAGAKMEVGGEEIAHK